MKILFKYMTLGIALISCIVYPAARKLSALRNFESLDFESLVWLTINDSTIRDKCLSFQEKIVGVENFPNASFGVLTMCDQTKYTKSDMQILHKWVALRIYIEKNEKQKHMEIRYKK